MNAAELKKLLAKNGCKFENQRGGSGHQTVRRGNRKTVMPVHGSSKELGKGLVAKILKDLGIK
ncbi:type II toxin-antitoxin system HicA family toxin [Rhizobium leguminosarum]|uniref:type II toxin-antitoxin system HicA family toxin n=1 Tax=Rhizobium leguminosarum TaxID=384 RepID=UPI001C97F7E1|nr:type II toxin-antitoxin system HicA family toxin [Rhizobium leguminosarum]MBY5430293.1 type II toxin-antitoxin system HicA family toxin [Rhizobium leguminosarum]